MKVNIGDLVKMRDYDTNLVGIVLGKEGTPGQNVSMTPQIGIKWFGGSGEMDWEPESWLEVVSESR